MSANLLQTKRFFPLMVTQFLGALNDNLFKNALLTLVTVKMTAQSDILSNVIAGLFILPFFLFSAVAGEFADKYPRDKIARVLKITEVILMSGVAVAYAIGSLPLLIVIMTLMGAQSAFFGPVKYSLLPQQLETDELITGNAYIESTTYMAILFGLILGTLLPITVAIVLLIILAVLGYFASRYIPYAPSPRPELRVSRNIFAATWSNFKFLRQHHQVLMSILGASWFWIIGALVAVQVYPLCGKILNAGEGVITFFLILFSFGVAAGSYGCNRLLKGFIHVTYVPLSAAGMGVSLFLLYWLSNEYPTPEARISFIEFFAAPHAFGLSFNLFMLAFWGGMYIVPLNAFMQSRAPKAYVASVIAGNNILNSLGMVLIAIFAVVFLALGFSIPQLFLTMAILSAAVSLYICALLPDALTRSLVQGLLGFLFRSKVSGIGNFRRAGKKVLIVANHVSLLDGVLLAAFMPERITFAINTGWTQKWFIPIIRLLVDFYPVDPANPLSVRALIEEIKKGRKVMMFPEGRVTTTGAMMKVYEGAGVIAAKSGARILPVRINGAQYSKFSYLKSKFRTRWFPKITLNILKPCRFSSGDNGGRESRHQIAHRLYNLMTDMMYQTAETKDNLFSALLKAAHFHGLKHVVAEEPNKHTLTFEQLLKKSYVLSAAILRRWQKAEQIGLKLPGGIDNLIMFFAVQACGKTVRMIAEDEIVGDIPAFAAINDIDITFRDKIRGRIAFWLHRRPKVSCEKTAVVLPQCELSHSNLLSGYNQLNLVLPLNAHDLAINVLPTHTLYGLSVATLWPLFAGCRICFYPHPSHCRVIPELVYDRQASVLFGDEQIFAGCGEAAHSYDFFTLRYALCNASLKAETFDLWIKKFGIRILVGEVSEEAGAVLSFNTPMYNLFGSLGGLLPGVSFANDKFKSESFPGGEFAIEEFRLDGDNYLYRY